MTTLYYTSTAYGTAFTFTAPTQTGNTGEGFFAGGEYWNAEYVIPDGFEVAESNEGSLQFYREGRHYALTYDNKTPVITDGNETIYLRRA